jgi:hypothetical protein
VPADGFPNTPEPPAEAGAIQDLVTLLLHGALQISHALDELHRLAHDPANTDPGGLDQVSDAIVSMTRARTALLRNADHLSTTLPYL